MNNSSTQLCTGCRVHEPVTVVGVFPICGLCLGNVRLQVPQAHVTVQRADPYDFVGKQYGWEIVGQTSTFWWNNPLVLAGGLLIAGLGLLFYANHVANEKPIFNGMTEAQLKAAGFHPKTIKRMKFFHKHGEEKATKLLGERPIRPRTSEEEKREAARQWWEKV